MRDKRTPKDVCGEAILNPTKDFLERLETREGRRKHRSPRYSCASLAKRARRRFHVLHRQENNVQRETTLQRICSVEQDSLED